jgi:AcrR family transcriptional regulator
MRYFGSKEKLFEEAVSEAFDVKHALTGVSRDQLGQAMANMLFGEQNDVDLMAMLIRSATDPKVCLMVRNHAYACMLEPLAALIGGRNQVVKASTLLSVVTGVWLYRFAIPIFPLADKPNQVVTTHIADLLQNIIDGHTVE